MTLGAPRELDRPVVQPTLTCISCGYTLHGLRTARCPECGLPFEPNDPPAAQLPWLRPQAIGSWNAFWLTVRDVLAHPPLLAQQVSANVEVDEYDAARFRHRCLIIASLSIAVAAALHAIAQPSPPRPAVVGVTFIAAMLASLLLFYFATFPLVQHRFERPNDTRRFRRLHDFTTAPLVLAPVVPIAMLAPIIWHRDTTLTIAVAIFWLLLLLLFYTVRYQHLALRRDAIWACAMAVLTLLYWGFLSFAALASFLVIEGVGMSHLL